MNSFRFAMLDRAKIEASGETGQIIGRAEYAESTPSYLLRYQAADGRAVEDWWKEGALVEA